MKDRDRYVVLTQAYLLAENLTEAQYDEYADTAEALWWKMSVADREYCDGWLAGWLACEDGEWA